MDEDFRKAAQDDHRLPHARETGDRADQADGAQRDLALALIRSVRR